MKVVVVAFMSCLGANAQFCTAFREKSHGIAYKASFFSLEAENLVSTLSVVEKHQDLGPNLILVLNLILNLILILGLNGMWSRYHPSGTMVPLPCNPLLLRILHILLRILDSHEIL